MWTSNTNAGSWAIFRCSILEEAIFDSSRTCFTWYSCLKPKRTWLCHSYKWNVSEQKQSVYKILVQKWNTSYQNKVLNTAGQQVSSAPNRDRFFRQDHASLVVTPGFPKIVCWLNWVRREQTTDILQARRDHSISCSVYIPRHFPNTCGFCGDKLRFIDSLWAVNLVIKCRTHTHTHTHTHRHSCTHRHTQTHTHTHTDTQHTCIHIHVSLVPRPSTPPVFDRLQYAKTEGEGLGNFITWSKARPSNVVMPPLNSQVIYETDLAFCASYKDGTSASRELHQAYETYLG